MLLCNSLEPIGSLRHQVLVYFPVVYVPIVSEVHRFVPVLTIITDMGHHFQRGDHIYFVISSSLNALVFLDLRKVDHLLHLVPRPFRGEVLLRLAPHIRGGQWQSLVPIVVKIVLSNVI